MYILLIKVIEGAIRSNRPFKDREISLEVTQKGRPKPLNLSWSAVPILHGNNPYVLLSSIDRTGQRHILESLRKSRSGKTLDRPIVF
ncbi:hypothetical protein [Desulfoplanes sp.]